MINHPFWGTSIFGNTHVQQNSSDWLEENHPWNPSIFCWGCVFVLALLRRTWALAHRMNYLRHSLPLYDRIYL